MFRPSLSCSIEQCVKSGKGNALAKSKELPLGTNEQIMYAYEHECGKDPKQARFSSYYDMKQFIVSKREKGINRV